MKKIIFTLSMLTSGIIFSQTGRVGINTESPKTTLDVTGKTDNNGVSLATDITGLQAPRLTREELTNKGNSLYGSDQKGALIFISDISGGDATLQRTNITSVGYYYFDGAIWQKINSGNITSTEPWYNQATQTAATSNTQNIYQMGNVTINKNTGITGVALDVQGAVRGGTNSLSNVGVNSAAFGADNIASGANSLVAGQYNTLWGTGSAVFGGNNVVGTAANEGNWSLIAGLRNQTNSGRAFILGMDNAISDNASGLVDNYIFGANNILSGRRTAVIGNYLHVTSVDQLAVGMYNAIRTSGSPTITTPAITDPVFQIGIGNSSANRNAMTVLHNSYTGIGISGTEAAAKPTEMLDIGSGNVRVRTINANVGTSTDRAVVADATGILKTVSLPVGAVLGDIKPGFQTADHSGWVRLDGRLKSSLSASQQTAATSLGFGTNLPNATNSYLSQNGTALGSIANSNSRVINQNNLPNVTLGGNTNSVQPNINYDIKNGTNPNRAQIANGGSTVFLAADNTDGIGVYNDNVVNTPVLSQNSHNHTVTTQSINGGVTQQSLNIQPQTMSVNMFVYLGQ